MNHELDFTSPGNEEKHMSEHNIDKDNIDIDVSSALNTDTTSDANTDTDANISADANNETESSSTDALNASSNTVKDNELFISKS